MTKFDSLSRCNEFLPHRKLLRVSVTSELSGNPTDQRGIARRFESGDQQKSLHFWWKGIDLAAKVGFKATADRNRIGELISSHPLLGCDVLGEFNQRQGAAARLTNDALGDLRIERTGSRKRQKIKSRVFREPNNLKALQPGKSERGLGGGTNTKDQPDSIGVKSTTDEGQGFQRLLINPLDIVRDAQQPATA